MNRRPQLGEKKPGAKMAEEIIKGGKSSKMERPLHILHLEDDPNDAALVRCVHRASVSERTAKASPHSQALSQQRSAGILFPLADWTTNHGLFANHLT